MIYSVIIPCYNEEAVLLETHKRLTAVMSGMDGDYELIYVNDGSRDRTPEMLRELYAEDPAHVRAVMFARNCGHQIAVSAGLDHASGDAVVIIDADLQDPPELIPVMAERWKAGAQVIYGKRRKRDGETAFKKLTAEIYYKVINGLTGGMIPRDTGDFRMVDKKVADVIRSMPEHARFLRGMFAWAGFRQEAVEYDRDKRFAGETHYPLKKMLKLAADGIFSFSSKPLKLATVLGAFYLAAAFVLTLIFAILACAGTNAGLWWLAPVLLLTTGTLHVCLGLAGEYIARIYDETRQRPLYIVADALGFDGEDA
ncbi:MAG: glycosyltransferase family 2 protein [Clostridia bacterium]|nr:glycosyltransferase family 2 protein [Clostridia bacterium]